MWAHCTNGKGKKYSDNQAEDMVKEEPFMQEFGGWIKNFENFVKEKGKVQPRR